MLPRGPPVGSAFDLHVEAPGGHVQAIHVLLGAILPYIPVIFFLHLTISHNILHYPVGAGLVSDGEEDYQ